MTKQAVHFVAVGQHGSKFEPEFEENAPRMLASFRSSCFNGALFPCRQLRQSALAPPAQGIGSAGDCVCRQPAPKLHDRRCTIMTSLAESVGRENIPEPAAKLQKLSQPPEQPLLVKKLSEHATVPTRGSAKAAGYDLSR